MPVVSPWLERASARDERLFLCIFAISTLIPWLVRFVSSDLWGTCFWNPYFGMFYYCSGYLGYLVMAHYIRFHLSWDRGKKLRIGTICLLVGAAFTGWSFWHAGLPGKMIETPMLEWSWALHMHQATAGTPMDYKSVEALIRYVPDAPFLPEQYCPHLCRW